MSGKGGVGKSTLTVHLAEAISTMVRRRRRADANTDSPSTKKARRNNDSHQEVDDDDEDDDEPVSVGLLDIDICGPSLPRLLGNVSGSVRTSASGWEPQWITESIGLMSIAFLLEREDQAVVWRGGKKDGLIRQFLRDVEWGAVDALLVDTPPGTSDEHLSIVQYLKESGKLRGAILVSTPQEVALADVRKQLAFCRKVKVPVIGLVENMAGFVCRKCGTTSVIFPPSAGGVGALAAAENIPLLGSLPLDPAIGQRCDTGRVLGCLTDAETASSPAMEELRRIRAKLAPLVSPPDAAWELVPPSDSAATQTS
uniref:Cytosolic Fe-S cluster assembly factor NUBP1 homolog n=2 Tax=Sexangularia sp. CB-2014 TaxID=1486929 RepID=A0A7S1YDJ3_9EUKA|mmetsp:Transcript_16729/g.52287  ORF Transcript_16729/g.52287 Transcript_16729/m.52287 type:complete len:312 (+) Transcript_16729:355-1290(+)